jgi:hypothetical protein
LSLYLVLLVTLTLPWFLWITRDASPEPDSLLSYYRSYDFRLSGLGEIFQVVIGNAAYLYTSINEIFLASKIPGFGVLMWLVMGLGICASIRKHNSFFWLFVACYFVLVLMWPFHPLRYALPLIPAATLFLFRGINRVRTLMELAGMQTARLYGSAFLALLFTLNLAWLSNYLLLKNDHRTRGYLGERFPYSWQGFLETFDWVRRNTDKSDILATAYDPMYYHYTDRRAIRPGFHKPETYFYPYGHAVPDVGTAKEIKRELDLFGVRYLIVDPLDGYFERDAQMKVFDDLLEVYSSTPELVFTSSDAKHRVYKLPRPH